MQKTDLLAHVRSELWRRGEIAEMLLHPGQRAIFDKVNALPTSTKEVCLKISRRWGKSYLAVVLAFHKCLTKPNAQVIIAAPSAKQSSNITTPLVREIASRAPAGLVKQLRSQLRWQFSNGSQLILGGFDTASESFRGLAADLVIVEEGSATNPEEFLYVTRSILLPVLLSTNGRMIHVYTPAPVPDHPIHDVVEVKAALHDALFIHDIHSCPLYTPEQISEMCDAVGGEKSLAWRREFLMLNERDTNKVCIPEFDEALHVRPAVIPRHTKSWVAADIGGVRDLSAFQAYVYDPEHDRVIVIAEATLPANPTHKAIAEAIAAVRAKGPSTTVLIVDAPGPTRSELAITYGESVVFPTKPKDSFHPNLVMIREALTSGKILIDPSCKLLIATLRSAMFNSSRTDYLHSDLIGHADHLACLIYGYRHRQNSVRLPQALSEEALVRAQFAAQDARALQQERNEWWEQ